MSKDVQSLEDAAAEFTVPQLTAKRKYKTETEPQQWQPFNANRI